MTALTDNELMQAAAAKDTSALKELYRRYEKKIFNFILRYTGNRELAQEIIQETFTRAWFSAHTFTFDGGNCGGWLYTIALNIARSEMSKKQYTYLYLDATENRDWQKETADPASPMVGSLVAADPQIIVEQEEMKRQAAHALAQLRPYMREVIIMKHYQHLKFREIAEITGMPEGTIKARYHRAVEILKQFLQPMEDSHV